jgi:hypothetical protein
MISVPEDVEVIMMLRRCFGLLATSLALLPTPSLANPGYAIGEWARWVMMEPAHPFDPVDHLDQTLDLLFGAEGPRLQTHLQDPSIVVMEKIGSFVRRSLREPRIWFFEDGSASFTMSIMLRDGDRSVAFRWSSVEVYAKVLVLEPTERGFPRQRRVDLTLDIVRGDRGIERIYYGYDAQDSLGPVVSIDLSPPRSGLSVAYAANDELMSWFRTDAPQLFLEPRHSGTPFPVVQAYDPLSNVARVSTSGGTTEDPPPFLLDLRQLYARLPRRAEKKITELLDWPGARR